MSYNPRFNDSKKAIRIIRDSNVSHATSEVKLQEHLKKMEAHRVNEIFFSQGVKLANNLCESERIFIEIQGLVSKYVQRGYNAQILWIAVANGVRSTQLKISSKKR